MLTVIQLCEYTKTQLYTLKLWILWYMNYVSILKNIWNKKDAATHIQYIKKSIINAGEGVEKREPSYTVGGNAN